MSVFGDLVRVQKARNPLTWRLYTTDTEGGKIKNCTTGVLQACLLKEFETISDVAVENQWKLPWNGTGVSGKNFIDSCSSDLFLVDHPGCTPA